LWREMTWLRHDYSQLCFNAGAKIVKYTLISERSKYRELSPEPMSRQASAAAMIGQKR
jgi:hypothetical protein